MFTNTLKLDFFTAKTAIPIKILVGCKLNNETNKIKNNLKSVFFLMSQSAYKLINKIAKSSFP